MALQSLRSKAAAALRTARSTSASLAWPIHGTDLLRLSIGIEDAPDIVADLDRAMVAARHVG